MKKFDTADAAGGVLFCALGVAISLYAWSHYELGSLDEMGPGLLPLYLGVIMLLLGAGITLTAMRRSPAARRMQIKPLVSILLGVLAFAFTIERAGAVVAILALVFLSALPEPRLTFIRKIVLSAALVLIAQVIFKFGLGMNFSLINGIL